MRKRAGWPRRRFLDARPRGLERAEHLAGEIVDPVRLARRRQLARRAHEKLRAEFLLQQRDPLADRRLAEAQLLGRDGKAAAFHGSHEGSADSRSGPSINSQSE